MATVTPQMIKDLRESTDAGLMDCKKALAESNGDMEAAVDWLRKKGLSKAAKIAGKIAAEGIVCVLGSDELNNAVIVEVNSQTDFVAKNDNFKNFASKITNTIFSGSVESIEDLKKSNIDGKSYDDIIGEATAKIGEKIDVRRFAKFSASANGLVNYYLHSTGKVASIVVVEADSSNTASNLADFVKDIAMHATAMKPAYLNESDIPQDILDKEKEVAVEQLKKEGKPEAMWDKILPGKIKRFAKENTLNEQMFVKDDKKSVAQALTDAAKAVGGSAKIVAFTRYEVGEGMDKGEACSFADEVAAQLKK